MAKMTAKVRKRLVAGIKKFKPILEEAKKNNNYGEPNTSKIVQAILKEVMGYDEFKEVTAEYVIKGDRCDLGIKLGGILKMLIEIKAVNVTLKDKHVEQAAIQYAAKTKGCRWAVLTSGGIWQVYSVIVEQPLRGDLAFAFDFCALNHRSDCDLEMLYLLCKEAWGSGALEKYYDQKQALSKYIVGAILQTTPVLKVIRRVLKKIDDESQIKLDHIEAVLTKEVIVGDVIEDEEGRARSARRMVARAIRDMVGADKPTVGKPAAKVKSTPVGSP